MTSFLNKIIYIWLAVPQAGKHTTGRLPTRRGATATSRRGATATSRRGSGSGGGGSLAKAVAVFDEMRETLAK